MAGPSELLTNTAQTPANQVAMADDLSGSLAHGLLPTPNTRLLW